MANKKEDSAAKTPEKSAENKKEKVTYNVIAGPFKDRQKALKQAALVKKYVASSVIEISGTNYIINIKSFDNKNDANDFKKDMVAKGIEATIVKK